jgi:hypothetical protein
MPFDSDFNLLSRSAIRALASSGFAVAHRAVNWAWIGWRGLDIGELRWIDGQLDDRGLSGTLIRSRL